MAGIEEEDEKMGAETNLAQRRSSIEVGATVGSRFCSCKVALPNPNHYIFHAQAKKKTLQKCNPSLDKGLLQKPKNLTRGPSRYS